MSQVEDHLKWCLKDPRRLAKAKPDIDLAMKHISKSEYNYKVLQDMEGLKYDDWALNAGFYAIYHCFLAILAKYGYESRIPTAASCGVFLVIRLDSIVAASCGVCIPNESIKKPVMHHYSAADAD